MANDLPVHKVLLAQMDELRARMEVLRAHLDQHALLDREDAIHELQQSLAELQTAHDELRAQGDELAGVQYHRPATSFYRLPPPAAQIFKTASATPCRSRSGTSRRFSRAARRPG